MDGTFLEMISTAAFALALFGVAFSMTQHRYHSVSRSFALFLTAVALNHLPEILQRLFVTNQDTLTELLLVSITSVSSFCLAPFFWVYVFKLTSRNQSPPPRLIVHLILPVLALAASVIMFFLPPDPLSAWAENNEEDLSLWQLAFIFILVLLELALFVQLIVYLYLIIRRLMLYRRRLQDFYASTEQHELRWIYVIGILGVLFWFAQVFILWIAVDPEAAILPPAALHGVGFILLTATIFWGLRQRPALVADASDVQPVDETVRPNQGKGDEKYEKSALTAEVSARIERKLRAAMETDQLYRNPNLSLWALARHVGASPNYISQTLNEAIGESFFDFINRHRIVEAMTLLSETDSTVLVITYDVGFNSRSAFYTAFKRVTGQTPTDYRKSLSVPEGSDDNLRPLHEA